ncbi:hypothetical protein ID866_3415 [Astraeus odoratus]|nr:hypothetical protein ID866_3415 [Astraeus odoratus]
MTATHPPFVPHILTTTTTTTTTAATSLAAAWPSSSLKLTEPEPSVLPVYGVTPPDPATLVHVRPTSSSLPPSRHGSFCSPSVCPPAPPALHISPSRAPIPLLPIAEFSRMHLEHATAHPPDSVLFPFLHGLEGDNEAQCSFFASTPSTAASAAAGLVQDASGRVIRPPRYRGLVWVLCDEDVQGQLPQIGTIPTRWEDDLDYDSDSSDYSSEHGEPDKDVDFANTAGGCPSVPQPTSAMDTLVTTPDALAMDVDTDPLQPSDGGEKHMHPVALRITTDHAHHDRRHSDASSDSTSTSVSSSSSLANSGSESTSATSLPSPLSPSGAYTKYGEEGGYLSEAHDSGIAFDSHSAPPASQGTKAPSKPARPPILTSTFLPSQLIQPCESRPDHGSHFLQLADDWEDCIDWEFKPAVIPEGISLRNFGVQVPLYISISDIVIYSPRGVSPAALRLAARFRRAVEKKRVERLERWIHAQGKGVPRQEEDPHITLDGFLKYGVYVLDADAAMIERGLPWMIMRMEGECDGMCAGANLNGAVLPIGGCCAVSGCPGRCTAGSSACRCDPAQRRAQTHGSAGEFTDKGLVNEPQIQPDLGPVETVTQAADGQKEPHSPPRATYTRCRSHTHPYHPRDGQRPHRERQTHQPHPVPPSALDAIQPSVNGSTITPSLCAIPNGTQPPTQHQDSTASGYYHHHCHHAQLLPPMHVDPGSSDPRHLHRCKRANTIDFAQREKEEMRDLTRASEIISVFGDWDESDHGHVSGSTTATHWDPQIGQIFLGNSNDVPLWTPPSKKRKSPSKHPGLDVSSSSHHQRRPDTSTEESADRPSAFETDANSPAFGRGFDICIECHEYAPFPTTAHLRAAEEHARALEMEWIEHCRRNVTEDGDTMALDDDGIPPRPPPHPSSIIHLPFPSSQQAMPSVLNVIIPMIRFLERVTTPGWLGGGSESVQGDSRAGTPRTISRGTRLASPWSPPSGIASENGAHAYVNGHLHTNGNGHGYGMSVPTFPPSYRPRPLKVLLYSSDGYTESSVPALCLLMAVKGLCLPEAYLEMQFLWDTECHITGYAEQSDDAERVIRGARGGDHQSWFDDARFDGSFPSRVLPFLYLGNLNHASNAYMLHALGITHVVSVGECALVPPPQTSSTAGDVAPACPPQVVAGQGPGGQGSLWIEEREGRIKVLDIKGVCDDGIDTLEHQLYPICSWIEKARQSGGQVLVHCRVGVSRSATVTIAYVMQHLGLSLVEAYLVVRSRRLSVLIQPNMRLLYNLLGWEVRLARERAGGDAMRLREELGKALSWPYLAREVHALNEKYLS